MEKFTVLNPTCLFFGKQAILNLSKALQDIKVSKVLLMYGKGSIKQNNVYQDVVKQLTNAGVQYVEYSGIKPNPLASDVNEASQMGRDFNIDAIVAVGGGSVIDSAKITALCIHESLDSWDIMKWKAKPISAVPLFAVLTLAATGTEMNPYAVLQNMETKEKIGFGNNIMYPKYSFLDPEYTVSVPANQTAYGIVDLIAHTLEAFFGSGTATLSDRFVISIIKEAMETAPLLMNNLSDYENRARIMWAATCALNGLTSYGRTATDWGVHDIGHTLSLLFDIPHGASLSIAYPAWLKLQSDRIPERIVKLGSELFNVNSVSETIICFEQFFTSIGSPIRLGDAGILHENGDEILKIMVKNKINGYVHKIGGDDYKFLVENMF